MSLKVVNSDGGHYQLVEELQGVQDIVDVPVASLLEKAMLDLERMEKMATSIRGTISKISSSLSEQTKKDFELEKRKLDVAEEILGLKKKNLELRQQNLELASKKQNIQDVWQDQDRENFLGDTTKDKVGNGEEENFGVVCQPRIRKRKISNERKSLNKRGKGDISTIKIQKQLRNRSRIKIANAESPMPTATGQVDDDLVQEEEAENDHTVVEDMGQYKLMLTEEELDPKDHDPVPLNRFDTDQYDNSQIYDESVEERASEHDFISDSNDDYDDIFVKGTSPASNEGRQTRSRKSSSFMQENSFNDSDRVKSSNTSTSKDKRKMRVSSSNDRSLLCKKVDLKTLKQLGALVDRPSKILSKATMSYIAIHSIQAVLRAKSNSFRECLDCSNISEMGKGNILLVKEVYNPVTYKVDLSKCGFQKPPKPSKFMGGWLQKLIRLEPETFDFIGMTRYSKTKGEIIKSYVSDFKAKTFFTDRFKNKLYPMNSQDVYVHFMQRNRYLPQNQALTMQEIIVLNVFNAPEKMHILNSAAYCYSVFPTDDKVNCYPPGKMMPHPTVHAASCQYHQEEENDAPNVDQTNKTG